MKEETRLRNFWNRVNKQPDGCWIWIGTLTNRGYGQLRWGGPKKQATHVAYFIAHNKWPENQVNHKCHNPLCVNPDHIYDGTQIENMADMKIAGRQNYARLKGEKGPTAKLTDRKILQIRNLHKTGRYTLQQLASKFHVSHVSIWYIVKLKTWTHV